MKRRQRIALRGRAVVSTRSDGVGHETIVSPMDPDVSELGLIVRGLRTAELGYEYCGLCAAFHAQLGEQP